MEIWLPLKTPASPSIFRRFRGNLLSRDHRRTGPLELFILFTKILDLERGKKNGGRRGFTLLLLSGSYGEGFVPDGQVRLYEDTY